MVTLRQVHRMTPNEPKCNKIKVTHYTAYHYGRVPNFTMLRSVTSRFRVTDPFQTRVTNDPKITLNSIRLYAPLLHMRHTLHCSFFSPRPIVRQLAIGEPHNSKMTLNTARSNGIKHMCYSNHQVTNSNQFRSTKSRFRVQDHFETSAPNNPKMTLNTRAKVHDICFTCTPGPKSQ